MSTERLSTDTIAPWRGWYEGGWAFPDRLGDFDWYRLNDMRDPNPGTQAGTYFKSVRRHELPDGTTVPIWTHGRVDAETLAAGWIAGGGRREPR